MLELKKKEAKYLNSYSVGIKWEFEKTPEYIKDYYIEVYSGESPTDMKRVSPILMGLTYFEENLDFPRNQYQKFLYKLVWYRRDDLLNKKESDLFYVERPEDPIASELSNKVERVLYTKSGLKCNVYSRMTQGKKCSCWDETRGRSLDKDCDLCKGTGIIDGFYPPYVKFINIMTTSENMSISDTNGLLEKSTGVIYLGPHPKLKPRDLIVENYNGNVWRVISPYGPITDKKRFQTFQKWNVILESKNLIENSFIFKDIDMDIPFSNYV